jgi:hypothetical protein
LNSSTRFGLALSCKQTSKTVTVNEQLALLPDESAAVQVTVVVPTGNAEPDSGEQTLDTPGQLSETRGWGYVTTLLVVFGTEVTDTTLLGQVIVGACVSVTVTVNEQL